VTELSTEDRRLTQDPRLWRVIIAASLGVFAIELDFFAVQAALPDMARNLDTSVTNLQWVISGYMLANGATMIVGGRVGDLLGRRRWLVIGIAAFGVSSLLGGLAPSGEFLIVMRLVQGVAAAFVFPLSLAVVTNEFPQARVERAVGMAFGIAAIGQAFGPLIGGSLTLISWRAVLLVNVPVAAALIVLAYSSIRESRDETMPRQIDWLGLGLVVASIDTFTYAVDRAADWGWTAPSTLGLLIAGLLGIVLFVLVEQRTRFPLMDLSLFRIREFDLMTAAGTVGNMGTSTAIFTSMILLQSVDRLTSLEAGVAFLGFSLGVAVSSQLSGRVERFPSLAGDVGRAAVRRSRRDRHRALRRAGGVRHRGDVRRARLRDELGVHERLHAGRRPSAEGRPGVGRRAHPGRDDGRRRHRDRVDIRRIGGHRGRESGGRVAGCADRGGRSRPAHGGRAHRARPSC